MAGISDNKVLIVGAIVIIFLGLLVAFQRLQTTGVEEEVPSPAVKVAQKLSPGVEVGGYPFVFNYRLAARCTRLFFDFNETHHFYADICPKDLTEEEREELGRFSPYPLGVEGGEFYYDSNLLNLMSTIEGDTSVRSLDDLRFIGELVGVIEG